MNGRNFFFRRETRARKCFTVPEKLRHEKVKKRPQIVPPIFNRRPCQGPASFSPGENKRTRNLRFGIFDHLRFIQDHTFIITFGKRAWSWRKIAYEVRMSDLSFKTFQTVGPEWTYTSRCGKKVWISFSNGKEATWASRSKSDIWVPSGTKRLGPAPFCRIPSHRRAVHGIPSRRGTSANRRPLADRRKAFRQRSPWERRGSAGWICRSISSLEREIRRRQNGVFFTAIVLPTISSLKRSPHSWPAFSKSIQATLSGLKSRNRSRRLKAPITSVSSTV